MGRPIQPHLTSNLRALLERAQIGDHPPVVVLARLGCRVHPNWINDMVEVDQACLLWTPRVVDALWEAFGPQIPEREEPCRIRFGLSPAQDRGSRCVRGGPVPGLVTGCSWDVAGRLGRGGETTLRNRYNEWNAHGAFDRLVAEALDGYDRVVGLDLSDASVDGSIHKAPCGGGGTGKSPVDRGKSGWKWSLLTDRSGIPVSWAADGANRNDCTLLEPTLAAGTQRAAR